MINGGNGVDTYTLSGIAGESETFTIYTRTEAETAGFGAGLAAGTEIVITRSSNLDGVAVIAELDNIEEIKINSLLTTDQNGNTMVDGGTTDGDTVVVVGNFGDGNGNGTSLLYNTIRVNGTSANDKVDISGLESDHRVVFTTNGGSDTIIGAVREQDIVNGDVNDLRVEFGASDGLGALVGGSVEAEADPEASNLMMTEAADDLAPLDLGDMAPVMATIDSFDIDLSIVDKNLTQLDWML